MYLNALVMYATLFGTFLLRTIQYIDLSFRCRSFAADSGPMTDILMLYSLSGAGKTPVGAAWPDGQIINGEPLPKAQRTDLPSAHGTHNGVGPVLMDAATALSLQKIAHAVVLGADGQRRSVWQRQG